MSRMWNSTSSYDGQVPQSSPHRSPRSAGTMVNSADRRLREVCLQGDDGEVTACDEQGSPGFRVLHFRTLWGCGASHLGVRPLELDGEDLHIAGRDISKDEVQVRRECQLRLPGRPLGLLRLNCVAFCSPGARPPHLQDAQVRAAPSDSFDLTRCADLPWKPTRSPDWLPSTSPCLCAIERHVQDQHVHAGLAEEARERPSTC